MPLGGAGEVGPGREGTLRTAGGFDGADAPPELGENAPGETRLGAANGEPARGEPARGSFGAAWPPAAGALVVRLSAGGVAAELP